MNLEEIFLSEVRKYLKPKEKFAVAVSGGVDSMTLLHLIGRITPRLRWKPYVLHLNHGLRGKEAVKDTALVRRAARSFDLTFIGASQNVRDLSRREKISLEDAGRRARTDFFRQAAKRYGFQKVLLAHHQDDLLETILMRLFRGTGLYGFQAMDSVSLIPGLILIRPLLKTDKKIFYQFAKENHVPYREDITNRDQQFFRNKIRSRVIPYLTRTLGGGALERLLSFRSSLAVSRDFMARTAESLFRSRWKRVASQGKGIFRVSAAQYERLHPAMQYGTLTLAYKSLLGKTLEQKEWAKIEPVIKGETDTVNLRKNSFFTRQNGSFLLMRGGGKVR